VGDFNNRRFSGLALKETRMPVVLQDQNEWFPYIPMVLHNSNNGFPCIQPRFSKLILTPPPPPKKNPPFQKPKTLQNSFF